ncbi:MAG: S-layer homology domain-containing protein, partial [Oscillospiraceae bacterium]|nr:S-layer homology domain-containing protein [Oscillospiraceae bacterium]
LQAENVHADNFQDALDNLDDEDYINGKYSVVYRCPVCGEVASELPTNCPICNTPGSSYVSYTTEDEDDEPGDNGGTQPGGGVQSGSGGSGASSSSISPDRAGTVVDTEVGEGDGDGEGEGTGAGSDVDLVDDEQDSPPLGAPETPGLAQPTDALAPSLDKSGGSGYVSGYPDNTFRPDGFVTRYEVASMIYALVLNEDKADYAGEAGNFTDVPADQWYTEAVGYLAAAGILSGYENGDFRGNNNITRAEFATIMAQFNKLNLDGSFPFADVPGGHWAYGYIKSSFNDGFVLGYDDGSFRPDNPITRAEAVTMINRMLGLDSADAQGEMRFSDVPADEWYYQEILLATNGL